ncbi:unnamed protein product, partial [marine sediment metagenome]
MTVDIGKEAIDRPDTITYDYTLVNGGVTAS